jgi:hypothetical protein
MGPSSSILTAAGLIEVASVVVHSPEAAAFRGVIAAASLVTATSVVIGSPERPNAALANAF